MTDSDNSVDDLPEEEPTGFRFSTALLWRIVAVGLFVVLGTFAVVQSLNSGKDGHDHDDHTESELALEDATEGLSVGGSLNTGSEDPAANSLALQSATNSTAATTETDFGMAEGLERLAKVSLNQVAKKRVPPISTAGYQSPAKSIASTNQFDAKSPTSLRRQSLKMPKVDTSFSANPKTNSIVAAKPPTQEAFNSSLRPGPPVRVAQRDMGSSGVPSGFQANPATRPAARPATSPFQDMTAKASQGFSSLKSGAAEKTNSLLSSAKQVTSNATSSASTALQNGVNRLGGQMRPIEAKVPGNDASSGNPFKLNPQTGRTAPPTTNPSGSTASPFRAGAPAGGPGSMMRPISKASAGPSTNPPKSDASPFSDRPQTDRTPFSGRNNLATQQVQPRPSQPQKRNNVPSGLPRARGNPASGSFGAARSGTGGRINEPSNNPMTRQASTARTTPPVASVAARNTPGDRAFEGVQAPALTVEKVSPREIQVMQTADFEIIVKNVGRVVADEVRVLDKVPAGTQYIGATPEPTSVNRSGDLQWSLGTMRPGQEKRVRYQLKPTQPGEIGSVAQVVFATRASMRTTVTKPVLEIRHTTEPRVMIGDNVIFDVVVQNKGDGPANQVIIQEQVPDKLEFSDGSPEIEYEIGTLLPGQSRRIQLGLRAAKVGKLRNVMFASAKGGLKAQHELDMEIVAPDLRTKSEGPTRRFIQRQATHRFSIENAGTAKAKNVEMFARLPSGLRFVSANNRGKYDSSSHSVVWVMPELSQGVAGTVELTTMPVEAGEQNIKFESFADLGLKSETKQELNVEHLIDVFFDIDDVVDPIEIGASTSYKIRVVNQGTKTATNVQIQIDLPPGLQPTDVDGNLRNQIQGQRVIFEPISTMRPGDELGVTVRAVGKTQGDHRVVVNMRTDGRDTPVSKEETTRVYSDR